MSKFQSIKVFLLLVVLQTASVKADTIELFIDADYSISRAAAEAIELGVRTALSSVAYRAGGVTIDVVALDHRGNVRRSHNTMKQYLQSDRALALVGGLHSPPYLRYRDFINENRILTLLPWSAAGPITRAQPGSENWIFRLSVDDTKSADFLVREAVVNGGCSNVALLLTDTGWGRANYKSLIEALSARGMSPSGVFFFPSTIGEDGAAEIGIEVDHSNPDCGILLAEWDSGANLILALHDQLRDFRVFSHWGITGGSFAQTVPHAVREAVSLTVLQTCGFRRERAGSALLDVALATSGTGATRLADIPAPTGFVHGFDLARILVAAIEQAAEDPAWKSGDIARRRIAVRRALQDLREPVDGILGAYAPPFQAYDPTRPDSHEALGLSDLCMAQYGKDGHLEDATR